MSEEEEAIGLLMKPKPFGESWVRINLTPKALGVLIMALRFHQAESRNEDAKRASAPLLRYLEKKS